MRCDAELCVHWAGGGCVCSVLDLAAEHHRYCECDDCIAAASPQPEPQPAPKPEPCKGTLGDKPSWMSEGQFRPCRCELLSGHDGEHQCEHTLPAAALQLNEERSSE